MAEIIAAVAALATAGLKLAECIPKLLKYLEDARSDLDITEDVERLTKELSYMQSFLKDAENKPGGNTNLFKAWVADVRELVTKCEDVADRIDILTKEEPKTHMVCPSLRAMSICCFSSSHNSTHELGAQVKKLLLASQDISSRRNRFDVNADGGCTSGIKSEDAKLREQRRSTPYAANNEHMVGLHETVKDLTAKLQDGASGKFVISIVGIGGLGKTTLARQLYNRLSRQHFDSSGWVCVTEEYNTQDILMSFINSMIRPSKDDREFLTDISSMEAYLRKYLSGRRFLVVVDDVWQKAAWESLERAFPDYNNGSKVILTTRNEEVAAMKNAYVHKLRFLDEDESWKLFCRKVFSHDKVCPSNLLQVGKEMVSKCSGLPLAIVVLGGILFKRPLKFSEWRVVRDNLWKEIENGSVHINAILTLSFNDLPHHLKPCFLYVAMFPEDFEISISKLMLLWDAEGFIEVDVEGCAMDVSKSYFDDLVGRSLFLKTGGEWIDTTFPVWIDPTFRVHDLLRDLAIRKASEIGSSLYYDGKGTLDVSKAPLHRRLAVDNLQSGFPTGYANSGLHTLCLGKVSNLILKCPSTHISYKAWFPKIHQKFEMLRVLDIQNPIETLPHSIGMLIHLRYLGISSFRSKLFVLPDTIGNLKALQTISIHGRQVKTPNTLWKLTQLKHLLACFISNGNYYSYQMGSLVSLETLREIQGEQWCLEDTTKLVNLRHLSMMVTRDYKEGEGFYENFKHLGKLQSLELSTASIYIDASLVKQVLELCPTISHLKISRLDCSGSLFWDRFATFGVNLEILDLERVTIQNNDAIDAFEKLPHLEVLKIRVALCVPICFKEGFAQLRTLHITAEADRLRVRVTECCMPLLEHLKVDRFCKFEGPDRLMRIIKWC